MHYAEPIDVRDAADCRFYHSMDIPRHGEVVGQWDLRAVAGAYLGNVAFDGKRVLDVGAASGFLTFEMEKRGGEVVSFDIGDARDWNLVPYADRAAQRDTDLDHYVEWNRQLRNGYWFAHRHLGSNAKAFYGDVYDLPAWLGTFDVVFLGMILGHLRDPFRALESAARRCAETIVVCNQVPDDGRGEPFASFMPTLENRVPDAWWALSLPCLQNMLAVLGFEVARTVRSKAQCVLPGRVRKEACTAIVAKRVAGRPG